MTDALLMLIVLGVIAVALLVDGAAQVGGGATLAGGQPEKLGPG